MAFLAIGMAVALSMCPYPKDHVYSTWSNDIHLIMSDNGTPSDFNDDWVIDWETNRKVTVMIWD